jgi:CarD family transcriptional regulator
MRPKEKKITHSAPVKKFKKGDIAIFPTHGIGKITDSNEISIAENKIKTIKMYFENTKLTINIPVSQIENNNIRHVETKERMEKAFENLKGGVKKSKGMWSRRAQEYETKINSGDIMLLSDVLRDLTRDIEHSERSYSERIIYETAVYRLASEYAVVEGITYSEAESEVLSYCSCKINSNPKNDIKKIKVYEDDFDDDDDDE